MKRLDIPIYVAGFLYTIVLLVAGAGIGILINSTLENRLEDSLKSLEAQNYLVFYQFDPQVFCSAYQKTFNRLEEETWMLGEQIELREQKGNNEESLKEQYLSFLARDYYITKKANDECGIKSVQIVYIYTNKQGLCPQCRQQGYELSKARKALKENGKDVRVYSFDGELGVGQVMKEKFGVVKYPAIVVVDKKYEGYSEAAKIESLAD